MESPRLVISTKQGTTTTIAKCSVCNQTFPLTPGGAVDPLIGQKELKSVFELHVKEKHSWRADANETAALRLRKAMEDIE